MKKIKVRFNLGKGINYKKWKISYPEKTEYLDPINFSFLMLNCQVKNNRKTADKIFNGANKSVCSWILCDDLIFIKNGCVFFDTANEIKYNPKTFPFWNYKNENVDGICFESIVSCGKNLYVVDNNVDLLTNYNKV
jgi:hypothetical protein